VAEGQVIESAAALRAIRDRMALAARAAGREPGSVALVAVSKTYGEAEILPVIEAGQRVFGENRVQEAKSKWPALRTRFPDLKVHLVGPLQSNKAKEAVALFDAIHSIDRPKIAEAIAEEMRKQNRTLELFVQVNTGEEPQKAGIAPREMAAFLTYCREGLQLPITGLMCIPPVDEEPALHFALLAKLAGESGLGGLSMGMSDDFETAIAFGATHVRVGSAIFGART
jgi:pyridoxal phosphate enzyme (YggS family)